MSNEIHQVQPPTPSPCISCPYRCDVPSGVWAPEEYAKLPQYDDDAEPMQAMGLFLCHQTSRDDPRSRLCGGWVATHGGDNLLAVRVAAARGILSPDTHEKVLDYVSTAPVFATGAEAAAHGMRDIDVPGPDAERVMAKIKVRRPDVKGRDD